MEIVLLDQKSTHKYDEFLLKSEKTLFFTSDKYRILLKQYLGCKDYYLLAFKDCEIAGVLPCFIKENNKYGNVLNSLPYYGSNGAVIEYENNAEVKNALIAAMKNLCKEKNCVASTIITSPFETDTNFYQEAGFDFTDSRRGLVTHLPQQDDNAEQNLMKMFDSKLRNAIRKAQKYGIKIRINNSEDSFSFLHNTHLGNMSQAGGKPKEKLFFDNVLTFFKSGVDYDIYTAEYEGKIISACLVFYFNKTVEYFTPVIVKEYRTYQPLCLIVLCIMKDAAEKGFKHFNWGGTGGTEQDGVYRFKKGFGSTDHPYYYFTSIYDRAILSLTKEEILSEYSGFYVFPFQK